MVYDMICTGKLASHYYTNPVSYSTVPIRHFQSSRCNRGCYRVWL